MILSGEAIAFPFNVDVVVDVAVDENLRRT
jgi:hypothetical protein